MKKGLRCNCHQ